MRPEVRAEYERALADVDGDTAFAIRLERFFTELRDPLVALYGADARFPEQWRALLRAVAATAIPRCGGSTTSARSRPTGCSASRRSAT